MTKTPVAVAFAAALLCTAVSASAQIPVESAMETRFQLDLQVNTAALKAMLPEGFTSSVAAQGPAKDANVRLIFVDRLTVNGPDGKPVGNGSSRFAYFVAPAKDASGANAQVVLGGITTDSLGTPGPFGNFLAAKNVSITTKSTTDGPGPTIDSQDWTLEAATGEKLELHVEYEHGSGNRPVPRPESAAGAAGFAGAGGAGPAVGAEGAAGAAGGAARGGGGGANAATLYYSAKDITMVQSVKQEQVLDILRNVTTNPKDRVRKFSFKCGGGSYAKLCDGTEKPLSWDNILWNNRTISKP